MAAFGSDENVFVCGGGREMVGLERLHELLLPLQSIRNPSIARLSNKSFSFEAAAVIASTLSAFTNLQIVDISDIIAGRPEDEALKTLATICDSLQGKDLIEVNLSDNALGSKGVHSCKGILSGKKIEKLFLCNNGLSSEACELVSSLLHEGGCPPLKVLNFYNNMSGDGGAKAVSTIILDCPELINFRFSATRSGPSGCLAIAQALSSLRHLQHLDLSDNTFDEGAALALAQAIEKQTLSHLNLRDCGLGESGTAAVLRALTSSSSSLVLLDLSGNDMSVETMRILCQVLPQLSSLQDLLLDDNEIGSAGATALASSLQRDRDGVSLESLRSVSLESCEVTAAGAIRLARAVSRIESFQTLRLNGNAISATGVTAVVQVLTAAGKSLTDMEDNDEDGDDEDEELEDEVEEEEGDDAEVNAGVEEAAKGEADEEDVDGLAATLAQSSI